MFRFKLAYNPFIIVFSSILLFSSCNSENKNSDALVGLVAINSINSSTNTSGNTGNCGTTGFCMIFATAANATVNAGIAGLDANCAADSRKPSNGRTFKALVSDGTNRRACTNANCSTGTGEHIDWVLKPSKEYRRIDGTTVIGTTTANGVFSFPLTNVFQTAITGTNSIVTGLNTDWTSNANDCSNWTTNAGGTSTSFAVHDDLTSATIFAGTQACNNVSKVVCVEQ
ncbi:DUF1554 domain-containing protein [Leptospira meyeri]|uniref:DUF1554 domain-containing protein n=1 Tax=Leptospira meyeri TaxID=29508 RepID=UPI001FEE2952|nr:DUF1554 domain-containing protein [Leptospira meyeri]